MYLIKQGSAPNQAHVDVPKGLCEEEHGRDGFRGPASHLYRRHPPTEWVRIEGPLRPRAFDCTSLSAPDRESADAKSVEILHSADVVVFASRRNATMPYFIRNADGDELYFIHAGRGQFETDYGLLPYEPGDYVLLPKGTTYRIHVEIGPSFFLIAETPVSIGLPDRGMLGQHALFDLGVIAAPTLNSVGDRRQDSQEWEVRIKRAQAYTSVVYPFYPMDVVGWKGNLWPAILNVRDFRPVMSARYHLPPSVHTTFQAGGTLFSTFAPRPLESDPRSIRVPFYHRNMDYDEVLFYHYGNFFSRAGIRPGMMTLHPQGIHHGPQPQAVETGDAKTATDEVAIMIESRSPLMALPVLETVEAKDYADSWRRP